MSAHNSIFKTSDFILLVTITIGLILEWVFPTDIMISRMLSIPLGSIMLVGAWIIIFTAKIQFKKYNQKSGPGNETTEIIQSGIFSSTRNPIYLGVAIIPLAIGFIVGSVWVVLSFIPVSTLLYYVLIIPEEKYLLEKFGNEYIEYCTKVGRWF